MKLCSKCKELKEETDFPFQNKSLGKLMSACKACHSIRRKTDRAKKEPEVLRINDKNNYYKYRESKLKAVKRYRTKHSSKIKNHDLVRRYGITLEEFKIKLKEQNNCCAVCGINQDDYRRRLSVDHNHKTGQVRGLLCDTCNNGIGYYEKYLIQYERYLKEYDRKNYDKK